MNHSPHSLSLYIAEHTRLLPKIEKLSAANQKRTQKTLLLRQPMTRARKTLQLRKPIRIEYYVVSQSGSSITSSANQDRVLRHPSSRLGWKTFLVSRLAIAYLIT